MPSKQKSNAVVARVLIAIFVGHSVVQPNELIAASPEVMESFEKNGQVDTADAAVAYCREALGKKPIDFAALAVAEAQPVIADSGSGEGEIAE